jgi:hypothetical protein
LNLIVLSVSYLLLFSLLIASGVVTPVWKSFILPGLFLPAAISDRFRRFLADWLPFLSLTVLFDALRAGIYAWIVHTGRPILVHYPITADRVLFRTERMVPAWLQAAWLDDIGWLEYAFVIVHASHFVLFFGFGYWLWRASRPEFARFTAALVLVMGLGLLGYAAAPTMPPWMASRLLSDPADVSRISERVYSAAVPALLATFDTNPVAAMPSLHMAFPVLMALFGGRIAGARATGLWSYVAVVAIMLVYLGEHYVIDLLAGAALAAAAFWIVGRTRIGGLAPTGTPTLGRRVLIAGIVTLVMAEVIGQWTLSTRTRMSSRSLAVVDTVPLVKLDQVMH